MTNPTEVLRGLKLSFQEESPLKITTLLERHHKILKNAIAVLANRDAETIEKQLNLTLFLNVLAMHAKAEEETLYRELQKAEWMEARIEGIGAQNEHELVYRLASDFERLDYDAYWSEEVDAKAKVLASLVRNHLREEENVLFPLAKRILGEMALVRLADEYVVKCRHYLDADLHPSTLINWEPPALYY